MSPLGPPGGPDPAAPPGPHPPPAALPDTKSCPCCGETILRKARKCKHCREILSPALRAARERQAGGGDLNVGRDALICGIIGLFICQPIFGPVAIVKGLSSRKKGIDAGMGTAGMVMGILACAIFLLSLVLVVVAVSR